MFTVLWLQNDAVLDAKTANERELQVKELEAGLRAEEALLTMLKKTRINQQLAKHKNVSVLEVL